MTSFKSKFSCRKASMTRFKSNFSWPGFFGVLCLFVILSWELNFYPGAPRNPWHVGDIALITGTDVKVTVVGRMIGGQLVRVVYVDSLGAVHEEKLSIRALKPIE
jgi:hypothetical protein